MIKSEISNLTTKQAIYRWNIRKSTDFPQETMQRIVMNQPYLKLWISDDEGNYFWENKISS